MLNVLFTKNIYLSRAMGYDSPQDFLSSIPDAVHCIELRSGHYLLHGAKTLKITISMQFYI